MTDMVRRSFLGGVFGGLIGGGVLVKASSEDVAAFGHSLPVDHPLILEKKQPDLPMPGQHLYNADGEFVAVITSFKLDGSYLTAHLVGALNWIADEQRFKITGKP